MGDLLHSVAASPRGCDTRLRVNDGSSTVGHASQAGTRPGSSSLAPRSSHRAGATRYFVQTTDLVLASVRAWAMTVSAVPTVTHPSSGCGEVCRLGGSGEKAIMLSS